MKNADAPAAKREEEEESMLKPLKIVIVLAGGAIVKVKKRFAPAQRLVSGSCTIFEQHAVFVGRSRKAFAVAGFSAACSKERRENAYSVDSTDKEDRRWMATPNGTASFALAPSGWVSLPRCLHQHTAGHPDVF